VRLVHLRGQFMQDAVPVGRRRDGGAHGPRARPPTRALCAEASAPGEPCEPANLNGGGQIVISGHAAAIDRALERAKGKGAKRAVKLQVSAPFHCSLMQPAADRLAAALADVEIKDAARAGLRQRDRGADASDPAVIRRAADPSRSPARCAGKSRCRRWPPPASPARFELGAGSVLRGLVKRIADGIDCTTIGEPPRGRRASASRERNQTVKTMAIIDRALEGKVAIAGHRRLARHRPRHLRGAGQVAAPRSSSTTPRARGRRRRDRGGGHRRRRPGAVAGFDVADSRRGHRGHQGASARTTAASTSWSTTPGSPSTASSSATRTISGSASLQVNLGGAFHCARAAAPLLLRAKEAGRIVNITSVVGEMRQRRPGRVRRVQGRPDRPHHLAGQGAGVAGRHRQRGVARLHRHRHDRRAPARGGSRQAARADPARPHR
jgi:hypothetical protein